MILWQEKSHYAVYVVSFLIFFFSANIRDEIIAIHVTHDRLIGT